jgi:Ni2+-binding GTPase involved in maturation of urease and hydrogenase
MHIRKDKCGHVHTYLSCNMTIYIISYHNGIYWSQKEVGYLKDAQPLFVEKSDLIGSLTPFF